MMLNRILIFILRIFGFLLGYLSLRLIFWKRKKVESTEDPLLLLPAVDIAAKIRKREITSKQVVQTYIDRIKKVNFLVNAVVDDRYGDALKEAEAVDELISKSNEDFSISKPLLGVPFTVKENVGLAGLSYNAGMMYRKDVRCPKSGASVEKLIKAGGIPLCVTNTPEYSMNLECYNHVNGRTLNPYDTRRTPGGSTGGEAALLGAGASTFGVGGDIGGSIRQPALNCGIFGHKPTPTLIDYEGYWPVIPDPLLEKLFSVGILARYAKDLKPIFKIMLGENVEKLTLDKEIDFKQMKVFVTESFSTSFLINPVDKEIIDAVRKATRALSDMGAQIYKLENYLENLEYVLEITTATITNYTDPKVLEYEGKKRSLIAEYAKASFGCSNHTLGMLHFEIARRLKGGLSKSQVTKFNEMRLKMEKDILNLLDDNSIILCPTFHQPALIHYELAYNASGSAYLLLANMCGLPAIHIPTGFHKSRKIPVGVQVIAGPRKDHLCLEIAEKFENKFGGWKFLPE